MPLTFDILKPSSESPLLTCPATVYVDKEPPSLVCLYISLYNSLLQAEEFLVGENPSKYQVSALKEKFFNDKKSL